MEVVREPIKDDMLPLSKPVVGTSGKVYNEILIPKGTLVNISTIGYNLFVFPLGPSTERSGCCFCDRNPDLWGPDASEFRPERWFEMNEQVESPIGVYGNL